MAYTILKVHRKRLLKLPLEGLREFLQDSLAQPWALEDEAVLRHLRASMTQLRRMRCDLPPRWAQGPGPSRLGLLGPPTGDRAPGAPPAGDADPVGLFPAGPEEFPTRPLGLERVSPAPGPLLPSPASETPPRVEEPASPGPATQPEPPGPPPGQAIVQHPPAVELPPHPPSAPRWCRQAAPGHGGLQDRKTGPWSTPGLLSRGPPSPLGTTLSGPGHPSCPVGHCSSCPSLGSDGHSQGRAEGGAEPAALRPRTGPGPSALRVHGAAPDARGPRGQSVAVRAGARSLWPAVTMPCLVSLSLPEGGTPRTGHQPLTQRDLGWPGPRLCGGRRPGALARPAFWPRAERALSQPDVASWALGVPHRSRSLT
ncbi:unnamed protein product [Nyctereutes procyonoides]|uniref:(raccoon dog) hypothetical protein n=1 Tax=Nyctereutes procyonoides TaxID=34880 RepID=A0A811ZP54_NYCPR|nr:unnamed protein product [Nyctereutes procyonoides]